jgi:hypothetical protein
MAPLSRLGAIRPLAHAGWFVLVFLAVFFGLASAVLPGWFVFSVLLVPAVAALMLVRPEYGLTACMALVGGLIHPALIPRVPILGGALAAADATLAMLAVYAVWTVAARTDNAKSGPVAGARWLAVSLGLFGVCFVIAVTMSLWVRDLTPTVVLGETRRLLYLITLPIAVVILRQPERQERFVFSIVVLGCLFSLGQILQGVFNVPVFGDQRMSTLITIEQREESTTRAITLGINVILFSLLLTVAAYIVGAIRKPLFFAVAGLLSMGILLTFGRTTIVAAVVCIIILVWWLNPRKLPHLAGLMIVAIAVGATLGFLLKPDSVEAFLYRMTTIGDEIDYGDSARWRIWETEAMLPIIQQHPLAGIGLGADYKGAGGSSKSPELNRFMHNAYLYMAGKMGLPALAFFISSMVAILTIGRRSAKSDASPWTRVVGAAGAALMVHFFISSITEPHFMVDFGVISIATTGALVYLSARRSATADTRELADRATIISTAKIPAGVKRLG